MEITTHQFIHVYLRAPVDIGIDQGSHKDRKMTYYNLLRTS